MPLPAIQTVVGANVSTGVLPVSYKTLATYTLAGTITAVTKVPLYVARNVTTSPYQAFISGAWASNLSTSNAGTITIDVLKRAQNAAASADASIFGTTGVLGNNSEAKSHAIGTSGITAATGSTNFALSTTLTAVQLNPGDTLVLTTTASSTQGTDLVVEVEITYQLNDGVGLTSSASY